VKIRSKRGEPKIVLEPPKMNVAYRTDFTRLLKKDSKGKDSDIVSEMIVGVKYRLRTDADNMTLQSRG